MRQATLKPIDWRGSSLRDLRAFPADARREAGHQLHLLQQGWEPTDWKPMPTVGLGTIEIRIHVGREYRIFVVTKLTEAVYVLHAFMKTSARTPGHALELARRRYRDLIAEQRRLEGTL